MAKHDINRVIEVGQELFQSKGYFNTGTEEILEKSGYPRSSFYYHFKSKEGFAGRVIEQYGEGAVAYYKSKLTDSAVGSALKRIENLADSITAEAIRREFKSECLVQKLSIECAGINDFLRNSTEVQMKKMLKVLNDCIIQGQETGEIRKDKDSMEMACMVQAQFYGAFVLGRLSQDGEGMKSSINNVIQYLRE
ncbi:MAG TPA: TetR/AcrR family transcriptional regulator [Bacteroides sp.]|nr:TetR/AcrR family transcriptional regulator [Bacteroides sp.]